MHGKRTGRCLCGLKVIYHFETGSNRKLTCEEARQRHPRARKATISFRSTLLSAGAFISGLRPTHGVVIGMIGGPR